MKTILYVIVTILLAIPAARADESCGQKTKPAPEDYDTLAIHFEDDIFYRTDHDYTSGQSLSWTTKNQSCSEKAVADVARWILKRTGHIVEGQDSTRDNAIDEARAAFSVGQYIYTPTDITVANPPLGEHPYGGFLYLSAGLLIQDTVTEHPSFWDTAGRLEQFNVQLGVTGPPSLARNAMVFIHSIVPDEVQPKGWDTQIKTEPGLVITYERTWRHVWNDDLPFGLTLQADPHAGGAVGNIFTYANVGGMVRLGYNVPDDFGPVRQNPALPGSSYFGIRDENDWGWYAFAGIDTRYMARNIFLDGNTWTDSRSVNRNPFVTDIQWGAAVTFRGVRITYSHVYRTQEFTTQRGPDQFGGISLAFRI